MNQKRFWVGHFFRSRSGSGKQTFFFMAWSPISTNQKIPCHLILLNIKKPMTYDFGHPCPGFGTNTNVAWLNWLMGSQTLFTIYTCAFFQGEMQTSSRYFCQKGTIFKDVYIIHHRLWRNKQSIWWFPEKDTSLSTMCQRIWGKQPYLKGLNNNEGHFFPSKYQ